jgi:hypothetical protein
MSRTPHETSPLHDIQNLIISDHVLCCCLPLRERAYEINHQHIHAPIPDAQPFLMDGSPRSLVWSGGSFLMQIQRKPRPNTSFNVRKNHNHHHNSIKQSRFRLSVPMYAQIFRATQRIMVHIHTYILTSSQSSSSSAHYSPLLDIGLSNFSPSRSIFGYLHQVNTYIHYIYISLTLYK